MVLKLETAVGIQQAQQACELAARGRQERAGAGPGPGLEKVERGIRSCKAQSSGVGGPRRTRGLSLWTRRAHRPRTPASGERQAFSSGLHGSRSRVSSVRGGGRCLREPTAVPRGTGHLRSRVSVASRPRWGCCVPLRLWRSTWTWTSSLCTVAPRAATLATPWTSTYLMRARKSLDRVGGALPGPVSVPQRSPQPGGKDV